MRTMKPITLLESGIPVPTTKAPYRRDEAVFLNRRRLYPFYSMEVGQSFLAPLSITVDRKSIQAKRSVLASMACKVTKRLGRTFTVRFVVGEGIRVWRLS